MSGWIVTGDLHFSDRPADEYRFGIFPWLKKKISDLNIDSVIMLGDITEHKDNHSSILVNRICDELCGLSELCDVRIIRGNHDAVDWSTPFFQFVNRISGITFYVDPVFDSVRLGGGMVNLLILPTSRTPSKEWKPFLEDGRMKKIDMVFTHQTFSGSVSESGYMLEGTSPDIFKDIDVPIISGDIHRPQMVKNILYAGSPYPVRFGDDFEHRLLLVREDGEIENIHFPCLRKVHLQISSVDEIQEYGLSSGDQVRVSLILDRSEYVHWGRYKNEVVAVLKDLGVENYGIQIAPKKKGAKDKNSQVMTPKSSSPLEWYRRFCKSEGYDGLLYEVGLKLLEDNQDPGKSEDS